MTTGVPLHASTSRSRSATSARRCSIDPPLRGALDVIAGRRAGAIGVRLHPVDAPRAATRVHGRLVGLVDAAGSPLADEPDARVTTTAAPARRPVPARPRDDERRPGRDAVGPLHPADGPHEHEGARSRRTAGGKADRRHGLVRRERHGPRLQARRELLPYGAEVEMLVKDSARVGRRGAARGRQQRPDHASRRSRRRAAASTARTRSSAAPAAAASAAAAGARSRRTTCG